MIFIDIHTFDNMFFSQGSQKCLGRIRIQPDPLLISLKNPDPKYIITDPQHWLARQYRNEYLHLL
jgi:hypothetical protein